MLGNLVTRQSVTFGPKFCPSKGNERIGKTKLVQEKLRISFNVTEDLNTFQYDKFLIFKLLNVTEEM